MDRRKPIQELLKAGQELLVQVTKEAIGDKGPTLTTYISIPGRYLVLMPCLPRIGVSIDTQFLSRLRGQIETSGTVIG